MYWNVTWMNLFSISCSLCSIIHENHFERFHKIKKKKKKQLQTLYLKVTKSIVRKRNIYFFLSHEGLYTIIKYFSYSYLLWKYKWTVGTQPKFYIKRINTPLTSSITTMLTNYNAEYTILKQLRGFFVFKIIQLFKP